MLPDRISQAIPQGQGFIRGYCEYAATCSDAPEIFHVGVAITVLAAAVARRLACPYSSGSMLIPNLYTLLVGPSRSGRKSSCMDTGTKILRAVHPESVIPVPGSYEELIAQLRMTPSGVLSMREFGHFLKTTQRGYGEPIRTVLMELFDHPTDQPYTRNLRKGKTVIEGPICLSLLAACSDELLFSYCVDEQTEMLTADGWKRHHDVAVGELCYTLNHETGQGEWQPVTDVSVFEGHPARDMVLMNGRGHSSLSTPNHRWPVRHKGNSAWGRRWRTSETLNQCDYIQCAALDAGLPAEAAYPDAFVELVAWAWTEGHWNQSDALGIVQSARVNPEFCTRIRTALTSLLGPRCVGSMHPHRKSAVPLWVEDPPNDTGVIAWRLNQEASRQFAAVISQPEKIVSKKWLRTLTHAQLELFIEISLAADGDRAQGRLAQMSEARADAFAFACLIAGKPVSYYTIDNDHNHQYGVRIRTRDQVCPIGSASDTFQVERVKHDGPVWCPTTPNGTWLARRNGSVYWTGNTTSDEWLGGFFGRMLMLYGDRDGFRLPNTWPQAQDYLVAMLHQYFHGNIHRCGGFSPPAWQEFERWSQWRDSTSKDAPPRVQSFISGSQTLAAKVSLLYACDAAEPNVGDGWLVSHESMRRAIMFVEQLYLPSIFHLGETLALGIWERDRQKVLRAIDSKPNGIERPELLRRAKVSSDYLESILTTLKDERTITQGQNAKEPVFRRMKQGDPGGGGGGDQSGATVIPIKRGG